jgi:hypothetical protein
MPLRSDLPLEVVDATPRLPRVDGEGRRIDWARIRPWAGDWKGAPGGLCEDPTHPIIQMGRVVTVKGERRIREGIWVCHVCKTKAPQKTPPRIYERDERHPEPEIRWVSPEELARINNMFPRVPPWWPGPEPKLPANATAQDIAHYRREHKSWERWSRACWSARMSLASFCQRARDQDNQSQTGYAAGYEA